MMLGCNDADCLAAGMRYRDLQSEAERNRAAQNQSAAARSRGLGAARHGIGTLIARLGARPRTAPEASEGAAAPPAVLGSAR